MRFPFRLFPTPKSLFLNICIGCGIVLILPFINSWHWFLDLGSHFQVQVVTMQTILLLTCLGLKYWKGAAMSVVILILGVIRLSPFIGWAEESEPPPEALRVTSLNVLFSNLEADKITDYLKAQDSDVIYISEANERWHHILKKELKSYPYVVSEPGQFAFGALLLSRHPFLEKQTVSPSLLGEPLIWTRIDFRGTAVTVMGLHPTPPVGKGASSHNYTYLQAANQLCRIEDGPLIVAGDFNATPWGHNYQIFESETGLKSCAEGTNTFTTWNHYKSPYLPFTGLMLDHLFYSSHFQKHTFSITPGLGSDHFGLTADFSLIP